MSAPGLAWQASLKRTEIKLKLLTDYHKQHLGICQATLRYAKANTKFVKNYAKSIKSS